MQAFGQWTVEVMVWTLKTWVPPVMLVIQFNILSEAVDILYAKILKTYKLK